MTTATDDDDDDYNADDRWLMVMAIIIKMTTITSLIFLSESCSSVSMSYAENLPPWSP